MRGTDMFQVFDGDEIVAQFSTYAEAEDFADGQVNFLIREVWRP
jgi:hypothetical protein